MSRIIRNERAQQLQGQRAGLMSRGLAFALDIGFAFVVYIVIAAGLTILWDLLFSSRISLPQPPGWFSALGIFWVLVIHLALGWGSTGRTIGKQLFGLRVVRADAQPLTPRQAFFRAFWCALFYPGILWVPFDRKCRSLQDKLLKTAVVYDWIPEAARPRKLATTASATPAAPRPASGQQRP